jgi:hypothetical protein
MRKTDSPGYQTVLLLLLLTSLCIPVLHTHIHTYMLLALVNSPWRGRLLAEKPNHQPRSNYMSMKSYDHSCVFQSDSVE